MTAGTDLVPLSEFGPYDVLSDWALALSNSGQWERALLRCREGELLCAAAGDVLTLRFLQFIRGLSHLETGDTVAAIAVGDRLLGELPPDLPAWRAKVLALNAEALLTQGLPTAAMDALSEALALAQDPAASYNHLSAAFSTATALRSMLLFEQCHSLLTRVAQAPHAAGVRTNVRRALAITSALWGCLLDLTGDAGGARRRYVEALGETAAMSASAQETGADEMRWRAQALEGFVLHRLGQDDLGYARIQEALAGFPPRDELVEVRAARLAEAVVLARRGRGEEAREVLASFRHVTVHENRELWEALGTAALADVDLEPVREEGARAAAHGWRRMSELAMARLWRDREGRFEALADRARVQTLVQEAVRHSAAVLTDPLTGLGNRRMLQERLDAEAAATRAGRRVDAAALLFVDVDEFKAVNDTCSHGTGDVVLQRLGHLVQTACRHGDTAIRYGGDEFVVLLSDAAGATEAADRLLAAVRAEDWRVLDSRLDVRVSVGCAVRPTVAEALASADAALFAAKRAGRDRVVRAGDVRAGDVRDAESTTATV
ncbi:GGDEF domain-containing protein [Kineococcus rubinsiae]|uniref:GGDEF domain-containing protein n=1 Tax=Kineococcus rubinsiae TaxID=2609562 RepID=UPI001431F438|nr:GGDEF domain-containing protein [Kineococcus rubinsiae]NIZ93093.1 GGDEF domain-containing protein [Kineococcus rubinsiae]